jgi:plasmid stabilization system protein ParE
MRLRYSAEGRRQLLSIGAYIQQNDPGAAKRVVGRIRAAANLIARFPGIGRIGRASGTREWVLSDLPYRILYELRGGEVMILNIFHTAENRDR